MKAIQLQEVQKLFGYIPHPSEFRENISLLFKLSSLFDVHYYEIATVDIVFDIDIDDYPGHLEGMHESVAETDLDDYLLEDLYFVIQTYDDLNCVTPPLEVLTPQPQTAELFN